MKAGGEFTGKFAIETKCFRCRNIVKAYIEKGKGAGLIVTWRNEIN
jgi:hypothetical protein